MQKLVPKGTRNQIQKNIFVPKDLEDCEYVFVRIDKIRPSLTFKYDGPFKVIKRLRKFYIIDIKNKNISISIDRLKPRLCQSS